MKYKHFSEIPVWKDAHQLTLVIYEITKAFPSEEKFRLVDQMCRASSSVGANIAEGNEKYSAKEKRYFLISAKASVIELEQHMWLAKDLQYITEDEFNALREKTKSIASQLGGWIKIL